MDFRRKGGHSSIGYTAGNTLTLGSQWQSIYTLAGLQRNSVHIGLLVTLLTDITRMAIKTNYEKVLALAVSVEKRANRLLILNSIS